MRVARPTKRHGTTAAPLAPTPPVRGASVTASPRRVGDATRRISATGRVGTGATQATGRLVWGPGVRPPPGAQSDALRANSPLRTLGETVRLGEDCLQSPVHTPRSCLRYEAAPPATVSCRGASTGGGSNFTHHTSCSTQATLVAYGVSR